MNDTTNDSTTVDAKADTAAKTKATYNNPRGVPRAKLWIFFGLFLIVGLGMYAGTLYRIQNYGYTGLGQDQLAHPEDKAPVATAPQN